MARESHRCPLGGAHELCHTARSVGTIGAGEVEQHSGEREVRGPGRLRLERRLAAAADFCGRGIQLEPR